MRPMARLARTGAKFSPQPPHRNIGTANMIWRIGTYIRIHVCTTQRWGITTKGEPVLHSLPPLDGYVALSETGRCQVHVQNPSLLVALFLNPCFVFKFGGTLFFEFCRVSYRFFPRPRR